MADCTELEEMINQLASNIAADGKGVVDGRDIEVKTLADVVLVMQELLPNLPITYNYVAGAIKEATTRKNKEADEVVKRVNAMRQEGRSSVAINEKIDQFKELMEEGEIPAKKPRKQAPLKIAELRKIRDNLRRWLSTSDKATEEKLSKQLDELNRQMMLGEVDIQRQGKLHQELQDLKAEIDALREQMKESKVKSSLRNKVDTLRKHLDEGTLPETQTRTTRGDQETQVLRALSADLRNKLNRSAPARQQRVEKSLSNLESRLNVLETLKELKKEYKDNPETVQQIQQALDYFLTREGDATEMLRSILFDLREKLPTLSKEKQAQLQKQLAELETAVKTKQILPRQKIDKATNEEIDNLEFQQSLIRREITDEIRALEPRGFWGNVGVGWDFVRLLMTSGEFSFALRQGGVYAMSHPLKWSKSMANAFKSFGSAKGLFDINKEIFSRKNAPKYDKARLILLHEGMSLTKAEDVIMNYWMDKLPVFRNFNRAAIAFFNTTRADMFDAGFETLGATREMTKEEQEIWANYINVMTGRGKLSIGSDPRMSLEPAALFFNRTFFSARYVASRFQMLTGQPLWYKAGSGSPEIRRMIAKEYLRFGIGLLTVLTLGTLVGADIEKDPRSSNFGKLKVGNRRLDPLMGFGQTLTYLSRILTGTTKTGKGEIKPLRPSNVFFYDGKIYQKGGVKTQYGGQDVEKVFARFLRSKLSPQAGLAWTTFTGRDYKGDEVSLLNSISQFAYPMTYGDILDTAKEDGIPTNVAMSVLAILGMGLQTYENGSQEIDLTGF